MARADLLLQAADRRVLIGEDRLCAARALRAQRRLHDLTIRCCRH
jgi:hypothetical protein